MPHASVDGRPIYYEVHGKAQPGVRPLLLMMGMGGSCRGWLALQVPDFEPTRPVIVYEHRGVGSGERASADVPGDFTTADLADDAAGLLAALDIDRADVLGAFMGGMAAQELALRHAERVGRLVLVGTYGRPDAKRRMLLEDWMTLTEFGVPREVLVRKRLLWTLSDDTLEQQDLLDAMMGYFAHEDEPVPPEVFVRQCRACLRHDCLDRALGIRQPTLLIGGRNDMLTPPKFHAALCERIPQARNVTLAYGGHLVMVEAVQRFNETVLQFLDDRD